VAGRLSRVPVVATFHGDTRSGGAVRMYEAVARVLGNSTRGVVAVSRSLEARLRKWVRVVPVSFVPNGLPPAPPLSAREREQARERLGVGRGKLCVAAIGRLSPEKGHQVLFEALRGKPATLLIAGDGPLRHELSQAAAGLDARFLGYLEDARAVYAAADVVALPSLTEGLPLVALEALALGRCIVASAVGELPQLLAGGAGVLVPPGDVAALSEALAMLHDGEVRARAEARAVERARSYGAAAMAGAYASLYGRALAGSSSSR
jgi:glycosyltransferase involved in cell wall biosynthesis